jgi:Zn-dependent protease
VRRIEVRVGTLAGIGLFLHASWFLVLGLVVWATAGAFAEIYPELPWTERAGMGLAAGLAFFGCLVVHELAHALAARRLGVAVRRITLFLFGGVAEIAGELPSASAEFAVALVGPATSLLLGSAFGLLAVRVGGSPALEGVTGTLALVNLGVALFNLLPGLPLDGGRLLRSVLWSRTGSFARATRVAGLLGRGIGGAMALAGVLVAALGREPAALWYVPMGGFLVLLASRASRSAGPPDAAGALAWEREGPTAQPRP